MSDFRFQASDWSWELELGEPLAGSWGNPAGRAAATAL